jgi:hypothetical protein
LFDMSRPNPHELGLPGTPRMPHHRPCATWATAAGPPGEGR